MAPLEDDFGVVGLKALLLEEVDSRFQDLLSNVHFKMATFVDPRYKTAYVSTDEVLDDIVSEILAIVAMDSPNAAASFASSTSISLACSSSTPVKKKRTTCLSQRPTVQANEENPVNLKDYVKAQVKNFADLACISLDADPYEWWSVNWKEYKYVARLTRKLFTVSLASVDSERLFSSAGEIIDEQRVCLNSSKAEMLIFLFPNFSRRTRLIDSL